MAIENLNGNLVMTDVADTSHQKNAPVSLNGGRVRCAIDKVEVSAAASATSTYLMHRLPSNSRIMPGSKIMFDDLASTGSPTVDIGVFAFKGNLVNSDDDDGLNDGIDVTSAGEAEMVKNIDNWGNALWDFVDSEEKDPFGMLDIKLTIKDADTDTGGTITSIVFYTID